MIVDEIIKEPADAFVYWFDFRHALKQGEAPASCVLSAIDLTDGATVTGALLASASGTVVSGTASGGSDSSLTQNATNLIGANVWPQDAVVNKTKKWTANVKRFSTLGATANDTMHFDPQPSPAGNQDLWALTKVGAQLQAGAAGRRYKIKAVVTTSESRIIEQVLLLNVIDN